MIIMFIEEILNIFEIGTYMLNVSFILVSSSLANILDNTFEKLDSLINPSEFGSNSFRSLSFTIPGRLQYSRSAIRSSFLSLKAAEVRHLKLRSL